MIRAVSQSLKGRKVGLRPRLGAQAQGFFTHRDTAGQEISVTHNQSSIE